MLAYILGLVVGTSSLLILVKAVLAKDLQKEANLFQTDIFWSGVGLFYGLALWVCAERITGALLLGQIASVCLIGWLVLQVKEMRLAADGISPSPNSNFITDLFRKPEPATELTLTEVAEELEETVEESEIIEAEIETATEETEEPEVETEEGEVEVSASTEDLPPETEEEPGAEIIEETTTEAETSEFVPSDVVTPEVENTIDSEIEEINPAQEDSVEEEIDTEIEVPTPVSEPFATTESVVKQEPEVEVKDDVEENKTKEADSQN